MKKGRRYPLSQPMKCTLSDSDLKYLLDRSKVSPTAKNKGSVEIVPKSGTDGNAGEGGADESNGYVK